MVVVSIGSMKSSTVRSPPPRHVTWQSRSHAAASPAPHLVPHGRLLGRLLKGCQQRYLPHKAAGAHQGHLQQERPGIISPFSPHHPLRPPFAAQLSIALGSPVLCHGLAARRVMPAGTTASAAFSRLVVHRTAAALGPSLTPQNPEPLTCRHVRASMPAPLPLPSS